MQIKDYAAAPYLVLATKNGLVKKSKLEDFDSNRSGGLIGINLRDDDELVGAVLCGPRTTCCWSPPRASPSGSTPTTRRYARWAGPPPGVRHAVQRRRPAAVPRRGPGRHVRPGRTAGGYAKRTPIEDYPVQGRGGKGVLTLQYDRRRGTLVGALIVDVGDEIFAITSSGG